MQGGEGETKPCYEGSLIKTYVKRPPIITLFPYVTLPNGHIVKDLETGSRPAKNLITHVNGEVMNGPVVKQNDLPWLSPRRAGLARWRFWWRTPIGYRRVVGWVFKPRTRQVVIRTHTKRRGMLTRRFTISKHPPPTSDEWKLRFYSTSYVYKPTTKKRKRESGKEKKDRPTKHT